MNILYIGPNESEWAQDHCPGSLAAAKWSRGFQTALSKVCKLITLSHTYMYPWPKGKKLWVGYDARYYPEGWECVSVQYPAVRGLREWWWKKAYAAKAKKIMRERPIDAVLIYNCYESWQVPVLKEIKRANPKVKIFPIVLDGDDPRKDDWGWMRKAAEFSDGFIPLSWWIHENIPMKLNKPSYHMDGGADGWCGGEPKARQDDKPFTLVHTGALDQWRGLDFMVEVVKRYAKPGVKFVFCGKSCAKVLREEFGNHPQIELPGFVSEEEMNRICNEADVLLNVRDPKHPDNILNYPSKLPHYLSFGRPVVSTRLQSLSPDYAEVVRFAKDDSVEAYLACLEEVRSMTDADCLKEYNRIKQWFEVKKRWDILAEGVAKWIES